MASIATQVWPSFLPLPLRAGYGITPGDTKLETPTDAGAPFSRQIFSDAPGTGPANFVMTNDEYTLFIAFWKYRLRNGSAWFRMKQNSGGELVDHDCRFVGVYKPQLTGPVRWNVSTTLIVRAIDTLSEADYELYSPYGGPGSYSDFEARFDLLINRIIPSDIRGHI